MKTNSQIFVVGRQEKCFNLQKRSLEKRSLLFLDGFKFSQLLAFLFLKVEFIQPDWFSCWLRKGQEPSFRKKKVKSGILKPTETIQRTPQEKPYPFCSEKVFKEFRGKKRLLFGVEEKKRCGKKFLQPVWKLTNTKKTPPSKVSLETLFLARNWSRPPKQFYSKKHKDKHRMVGRKKSTKKTVTLIKSISWEPGNKLNFASRNKFDRSQKKLPPSL